ncbi:MAG: ABC transporter substrate-binding protein [Betaproteobacteria bacterium]|nr:ABC transporter substrate-binding protein [Betaproteobacteria bacterium]
MNFSRRTFVVWAGIAALSVFARLSFAQLAPDALVKGVADDVLKILSKNDTDAATVAKAIEEKIVMHFDFERIARLAVGKSWRQATPEQQQSIVAQFRALLLRSYTTAYSAARGVVVDVKPVKLQPTDDDVQVKTQIRLPGGAPPISVDYSMFKAPDAWKVYDVTVNEVSLVSTYRSTFSEQIKQGGIDGLIKALTEMNSRRTAAAQTKK